MIDFPREVSEQSPPTSPDSPTPAASSLEVQFGWGMHGANRLHYNPSPDEIRQICEEIREQGFTDHTGEVHRPWSEGERNMRATGRMWHQKVELKTFSVLRSRKGA